MTDVIKDFLDSDDRKIEKLISEYPVSVPTKVAAEFLGIDCASLRAIINENTVGLSWKKEGKLNKGFFIPTPQFLRWYIRYAG